MNRVSTRMAAALGIATSLSLLAVDVAEARRGGSFGSRGMRTFSAPAPTRTAPRATAPIQRSMTPQTPNAQRPANTPVGSATPGVQPQRRGLFGGMGGALLGGLAAGGLLGMMMGNGFGGLNSGMMNTLMQFALIGLGAYLLMALFRRRAPAAQAAGFPRDAGAGGAAPDGLGRMGFPSFGSGAAAPLAATPQSRTGGQDIPLTLTDRDRFEQLLAEVQDAFTREDYAALRAITTPEIMSYLSEELSQNATQGRRNEVSQTKLLQADIAEAWNEDDQDYVTVAMRFESIDVMRDRQSGAVVSGDPNRPSEATELWTFVRQNGAPWKLSAIQES